MQSEKQWAGPQVFSHLRDKRVVTPTGEVALHSFLQLYGMHEYNQTNGVARSFSEMQEDDKLKSYLQSNTNVLQGLLSRAGITYGMFNQGITDLDLSDSSVVQKFLSNASLNSKPLTLEELAKLSSSEFRSAVFREPESGIEVKGQSLMLYHSAQQYASRNPPITTNEAFKKNKGKSNKAVQNNLLRLAGLIQKKRYLYFQ